MSGPAGVNLFQFPLNDTLNDCPVDELGGATSKVPKNDPCCPSLSEGRAPTTVGILYRCRIASSRATESAATPEV
ncbi:MAG TPA: hypothetical protein VNJ04_13915 [Gemmatimonadaceae bacterium]|nr:hypothetical protein [Gemmatimonadaceae bacterium]